MQRRIFGIETEYGLNCASTVGGEPPLDAEQAAARLFAPLLKSGGSTNLFLPNGGRVYLDIGAHPEYATAECSTVWDLLTQVRAGSTMLADLAAEVSTELQSEGIHGELHLFANNFDSEGNSYGCHENYLLRRRRDFREMADALITFFVTRQVIAGAGDIKNRDDGEPQYVFSARADQMHDALSSATTRARPIINTRDEPLADSGAYRRLHVIVGDTNMAEPTTALKVAASDLVLSAMERAVGFSDLALKDPLLAIRQINDDLTGKQKVELADGRQMTAVQLQDEIRERAVAAHSDEELSDLYRYLIDLWGRVTEAVRSGDWQPIETEIDFAIKKKLLDSYQQRSGAALDDARVTRLLLSYHDITASGLLPKMEKAGLVVRLTSEEQVEYALGGPPLSTRAVLRGRIIRAAQKARRDLGVDWVNLRLEGHSTQITLQDPFATEDERVDLLLRSLEQDLI